MSLKQFLEQENRMAAFMNLPKVEVDQIDEKWAQQLFQRIDIMMSPEALYRDGERSKAQAAKFAKMYKDAWAELKAKGFTPKGEIYNMV